MSVESRSSASNLEYYRKQAKALLKGAVAGAPEEVSRFRSQFPNYSPGDPVRLSDAQWVVARENGSPSWPKFRAAITITGRGAEVPPTQVESAQIPVSVAIEKPGGMGSEAVKAKTGKGWDEWFEIFDRAGLHNATHQEIVAKASEHGVGSWWRQMVAVGYEQARGLRQVNMSCAGDYQVSASKTIQASMDAAFDAWLDEAIRDQWLPGAQMTIRKVNAGKNIRVGWHEGGNMDVRFTAKGAGKCSIAVDHGKLGAAEDVDRYRAYWQAALERLKVLLEA